jgi:hypothetical protein
VIALVRCGGAESNPCPDLGFETANHSSIACATIVRSIQEKPRNVWIIKAPRNGAEIMTDDENGDLRCGVCQPLSNNSGVARLTSLHPVRIMATPELLSKDVQHVSYP